MNKTQKILIAVVLTNLLCTFVAGHGAIPLGLVEILTLYSIITFNFDEFPFFSFWTLATLIMGIGQVLTVVAINRRGLKVSTKFGKAGTVLLLLALIIVAWNLRAEIWILTIVTSMPFLVSTIAFWWSAVRFKTTPAAEGI